MLPQTLVGNGRFQTCTLSAVVQSLTQELGAWDEEGRGGEGRGVSPVHMIFVPNKALVNTYKPLTLVVKVEMLSLCFS